MNWKSLAPIGFPQYEVSECGKVRHIKHQNILTEGFNHKGYIVVDFWIQGHGNKHLLVHRLVALVWCPNPLVKPIVNHDDEDIHNNHRLNLRWLTSKENRIYSIEKKRMELKKDVPF
jgi:hypothetical protein